MEVSGRWFACNYGGGDAGFLTKKVRGGQFGSFPVGWCSGHWRRERCGDEVVVLLVAREESEGRVEGKVNGAGQWWLLSAEVGSSPEKMRRRERRERGR
ncbi:hypothetical protein HAX54_049844 [Datura stramonium]|uniref:Uncharacterized protein n=1 Tax=Datura stramonium TaxID=4076 RepID=A0ABS8SVV4_DATST|nr:hypothetical protein [Datura stramonium]